MKGCCRSLPLVFFLTACCLANNGLEYETVSTINQYHLARLQKGMSEKTVLYIMHKPYSYETFQVGDDIYDVWFYVTRPTGLDQTRMVPQNLTPLTFKNGVLVGVGYNWYYYAMKEQAAEAALQSPAPEKPKTQDAEDKEFEKALKARPEKKSNQKQPEKKLPPNVRIIGENEDPCECAPREEPCCVRPKEVCKMDRFSGLLKGMTEWQILDLFGEPLRRETFQIGEQTFDGWFYDTIPSKTGRPSTIPQHQTVLTFENTLLVSVSDRDFYKLRGQADVPKGPVSAISEETFSKIHKGMTESDAMRILGRASKRETFVISDDTYNVWFYKIKGNQTIPLTFKNGILVGMTVDDYHNVKGRGDCYGGEGERMQEDESEQNFNYW